MPAAEERSCPQCGRSVVLKTKTHCAYCGARLPGDPGNGAGGEPTEERPVDLPHLLEPPSQPLVLPRGATYPVACGACGEKMPETMAPFCPRCHAAVRDPFTGKRLFSNERTKELGWEGRLVVLLLALVVLGAMLLGVSMVLRRMMESRAGTSAREPAPARSSVYPDPR